MSTGIYIRTEEYRKRISERLKGIKWSKEQNEKRSKTIKRLYKLGKIKKHFGRSWNKGLTKETDERIKKFSEKMKGRQPWNKGLSVRLNPKTEFKKGYIPWSKGLGIITKICSTCGKKFDVIKIPKEIKNNKKLLRKCIKGIADTDFTLIFTRNYNYPRITAKFASKNLVKNLENVLRNMQFTLNTLYNYKQKDNKRNISWVANHISLDGPHNLKRWLKLIGFSNLRIISRYDLWKKKGFLEPKTTLPERLKQLSWGGGDLYGQHTNF